MGIAAELCIFTNDRFTVEAVSRVGEPVPVPTGEEMLPIDGFLPPPDTGDDDEDDDEDDAPAAVEAIDPDEEEA
jgi:hypothetical protein